MWIRLTRGRRVGGWRTERPSPVKGGGDARGSTWQVTASSRGIIGRILFRADSDVIEEGVSQLVCKLFVAEVAGKQRVIGGMHRCHIYFFPQRV